SRCAWPFMTRWFATRRIGPRDRHGQAAEPVNSSHFAQIAIGFVWVACESVLWSLGQTRQLSLLCAIRHWVRGSCPQFSDWRSSEEDSEEVVGDRLEPVGPFEHLHILLKVNLGHATEWSQEVPKPGPDSLQGIAVDLALAIAVVVAGPLALV